MSFELKQLIGRKITETKITQEVNEIVIKIKLDNNYKIIFRSTFGNYSFNIYEGD